MIQLPHANHGDHHQVLAARPPHLHPAAQRLHVRLNCSNHGVVERQALRPEPLLLLAAAEGGQRRCGRWWGRIKRRETSDDDMLIAVSEAERQGVIEEVDWAVPGGVGGVSNESAGTSGGGGGETSMCVSLSPLSLSPCASVATAEPRAICDREAVLRPR